MPGGCGAIRCMSGYLGNSTYTGNSEKAWYLLADPADLPVIEVAFLNGQESPTIETIEGDANVLGIPIPRLRMQASGPERTPSGDSVQLGAELSRLLPTRNSLEMLQEESTIRTPSGNSHHHDRVGAPPDAHELLK